MRKEKFYSIIFLILTSIPTCFSEEVWDETIAFTSMEAQGVNFSWEVTGGQISSVREPYYDYVLEYKYTKMILFSKNASNANLIISASKPIKSIKLFCNNYTTGTISTPKYSITPNIGSCTQGAATDGTINGGSPAGGHDSWVGCKTFQWEAYNQMTTDVRFNVNTSYNDVGIKIIKISYYDESIIEANTPEFIEVGGVLWAKGNLQYNNGDGDPNFYDNNFRIAPTQWHYFGYDDEDFNVGDTCVMSSTQIDYFNWAVTGSNASVYTQYSTITDKNVQGKMFTNDDGSDETTNFSESKYGDLAYWASGGVYQYPSFQDFDKLCHSAVRLIKYYLTESGKEIKGIFFSDINKKYGKYLTNSDLEHGVFLPLIGYRKGQSTDVYQREERGYYQCIAQDSLGNQQFFMYPQNGTNQYAIAYYNPRQYMRIGFPIRPVLAANTSTLAGTSNGGGRITIDDKTYNDEYFRHHLFEMNGPAVVAIHPSSSFNAMVFYNGELQEALTSIDYTTKSQVDSLMVIFYSNNELISWQTDRYLKDDFSPQWRNNAIGYEVTADISGLDSSIGKHNAVIPFTFAKDGFQAVININYSYEVIDGITVIESDYKVYTDNPVIFCTAHQPVSIPIYMKNAEEVTGIELPFYVDGMSFTGTEEDLLLGAADDWSSYLQLAERASGLTAQEGSFRVFQDSVQRMSGADIIMNASESIPGNDGLLLTVVMVPPKSGVFSSHEITSPIILHFVDESQVELDPIGLKIVAERLPGDNNDDGVVDANDQLGGNVYNINLSSGNVALGIVNETSSMPVRVQNTEAVTSFAVTVSLPERIELVDDVDTFIEATERGAGFDFSAVQNDDGTITITGTSSTPLEAGEGPVLNLKVKTAWQNTYTIPVTNITVTTDNGDIKQLPDSETRLGMQGVRGDMNGDGRVDLSDALYIINLATGQAE